MIPSVIRCKVHSGAPAAVSMNETVGIIRFLKNIILSRDQELGEYEKIIGIIIRFINI